MKRNESNAGLDAFDWNFDAVPDDELVACCYWEYARESAFIRDTLSEYRDWHLAGGKWDENSGALNAKLEKIQCSSEQAQVFMRGCAFDPKTVWEAGNPGKPNYRQPDAPLITGSFPAPWQSLSSNERKSRMHIRSRKAQFAIVPIKLAHWSWAKEIARECQRAADDQHEQRKTWERKYLRKDAKGNFFMDAAAPVATEFEPIRPRTRWGVGETLLVDIAWECFTNDEIANYFRKRVKRARPQNLLAPSGQGHKPKDWRAHLTRLAVMRLLSRYTPKEILGTERAAPLVECQSIHSTKQFAKSKWGDPTKWYDARREAGKLYHSLFSFLSNDDKPISWKRQPPDKQRGN